MKIFVKTLRGTHFQIEVQPQDTVVDVKRNIEIAQGRDVYPAAHQMLTHQGKVLKDNTTLAQNNVAENSHDVVIMLTKNKTSPGEGSTTSPAPTTRLGRLRMAPPPIPTTVYGQGSTTSTALATRVRMDFQFHWAAPAQSPTTELDVYGQAAYNPVAGNNLEGTIQQILDMGGGTWDRDIVLRALRAAFNNPERAVEYLYSLAAQPPPPTWPTLVPSIGPNANPRDIFAQDLTYMGSGAAGVGSLEFLRGSQQLAAQPPPPTWPTLVPSIGPNANPRDIFPQDLTYMGSGAAGVGSLEFLRGSQQFQTMRAMVQANPQILQPMLQELGRQDPQLIRLIQEHWGDFFRLIHEPVEGNIGSQLAAAMPQSVTVTPEEHEAIERLEAMGFDRAVVLEMFFYCNKNEELAANYLVDRVRR